MRSPPLRPPEVEREEERCSLDLDTALLGRDALVLVPSRVHPPSHTRLRPRPALTPETWRPKPCPAPCAASSLVWCECM